MHRGRWKIVTALCMCVCVHADISETAGEELGNATLKFAIAPSLDYPERCNRRWFGCASASLRNLPTVIAHYAACQRRLMSTGSGGRLTAAKRRFVTDNRDYCFAKAGLIRLGSGWAFVPVYKHEFNFGQYATGCITMDPAPIDSRVTRPALGRNVELHCGMSGYRRDIKL